MSLAAKLILIDMVTEQLLTVMERYRRIKAMTEEEAEAKIEQERERTKRLKEELEADLK